MGPPPRPASAAPSQGARGRGLLVRALSTLAMVPPVLAAVWFGPPWSDLLVAAAMAILCWEWARMTCGPDPRPLFARPGPLLLLVSVLAACVLAAAELWSLAAGLLGFALLAERVLTPGPTGRWLAGGVLYLGLPALAFIWLRHRPEDGLAVIVWLLLVVWAGDIFAYLVGSRLRGPKLWPAVSPSKTWSGLIGGVLAAAGVAALGALYDPDRSAWVLALAGAGIALVAAGGDLLESAVKRRFGVKDVSAIIPGHGGLLDRVDALLVASLALAGALWLAGR